MKKYSEIISIILFCAIIASLSVSFVISKDIPFSEQENRELAQAPSLDRESFFSGEFGKEMNLYFSDQFPLRSLFVNIKSMTELAFLKGENNGVLFSQNQLAVKNFNSYQSRINITENTDRIYPETIKAQFLSVNALAEKLNIPLVTVIPPRTVDIADSVFKYDRPDGDTAFELMKDTLSEKTGYINTLDLLRPKYENGEYVYYRTDHHWTTLGAYYTYCEIMKNLGHGENIIPITDFEIEQVADFSGTTAARASFPFYEKDTLEIWHLSDENDYEVTVDGEKLDSFYSRDFLNKSDKYSVFLDGTHDITEIRKKGEERKTLLIAKDSFANCLIPFLAREFDIIALNLRTNTAISAFAENYSADAVLIVFNTENIITSADLGNVR